MPSTRNVIKQVFWAFYDLLVWLELWIHERLLLLLRAHPSQGSFAGGFGSSVSRLALKRFLVVDHRTRSKVISDYGIPLFGGLHPKNVFNFRHEFFQEHVSSNDVVLDVACGSGLLLYKLSSKIRRGVGLELSEQQLATCRGRHSASNLSFVSADILKYDYSVLLREESVSVAIFSHILEHIEDVPGLLRTVGAPRVLVCVPSQENWLTQLKIHYNLPYHTDGTHFREYTREMLANELAVAGYRVLFMGFNSEGEIICKAENSR
jgi:SAM-dependent methyltransferase